MLMERDGLIEKHAKAAGIEVKTNWQKVAGPSVINDGLFSGNVHFGAVGAPSLITLWSRTKTNVGVKGVAAMTSYPLYFVTRNPELKSLKDLSAKDKIAVPSVKISTQAIMLQMAAADLFGQPNYQKFDELTVSLSHPDAMMALMNNTGGVNAHFATSPFYEQEMKFPGARAAHHQLRHSRRARLRAGGRRDARNSTTPIRRSTRRSWPPRRKRSTRSTRTRRRPRRPISRSRTTGRIRSTTSSR